jgi:hypothetical protein
LEDYKAPAQKQGGWLLKIFGLSDVLRQISQVNAIPTFLKRLGNLKQLILVYETTAVSHFLYTANLQPLPLFYR